MAEKLKLTNDEIKKLLGIEPYEFPKYSTQLLNLANQNAQGTRPAVVGQMSELIKEFSGKSISEWEEWYLNTHPDAIRKATLRIAAMVKNLSNAISQIDEPMIERWVKDLVIIKTFIGLKFQEAVLKRVAAHLDTSYRLSEPGEEARGIDGFIGAVPVSIKPETYKTQARLSETINAKFIYYRKVKDGLKIDISGIS
jgi:hypothetical protein